jgi:hypothetical protein
VTRSDARHPRPRVRQLHPLGNTPIVVRRRIELAGTALAVICAVLFAGLWIHARSSIERESVVVVELSAAKTADVNMPYPIRIVDRDGKEVAGFDHHGTAQAVQVPIDRYPVVVKAGYEGNMGCRTEVTDPGGGVVDVELTHRGCVARQIT